MQTKAGETFPLGATVVDGGVNFSVYSGVATSIDVCVRRAGGQEDAAPLRNSGGGIWSGRVPDLGAGAWYGFRVDGPHNPAAGQRCNPAKRLLDPYSRAIAGNVEWRPSWLGDAPFQTDVADPTDSGPDAPWSVVCPPRSDASRIENPVALPDSVIYEAHVRGLTWQNPAVPLEERGTYAGLANSAVLTHLKDLGVTTVELLPIHQSLTDGWVRDYGRANYWGYSTIGFFAAHGGYSAARRRGDPPGSELDEFKAMVDALHAHEIEVILDVVYNHTAEGDQNGPTLCFRGLDNVEYYDLAEDAGNPDHGLRDYDNLTGCGNTINASSAVVRRLIRDSLEYWVRDFGIDGFRFDLGPALAADLPPADPLHDADPSFDPVAPFFEMVDDDPVLQSVKLIAEPWGAGGDHAEQFPARWSTWNGAFRDNLRDFWREPPPPQWSPSLRVVANRLAGSPDRFAIWAGPTAAARGPDASINLITCHDGFTLLDVVSYNDKNNVGNPKPSGTDENHSWNCGNEGPTTDPSVLKLRRRQSRNMLVTLLMSIGVPMLLAGDELGRTQRGNNDCWAQDSELSWLEWGNDDGEITRLIAQLCLTRKQHSELHASRYVDATARPLRGAALRCYGTDGEPLTDEALDAAEQHAFTVLFDGPDASEPRLALMLNGYDKPIEFAVPSSPRGDWSTVVDTSVPFGSELPVATARSGATVPLVERSTVVLERR